MVTTYGTAEIYDPIKGQFSFTPNMGALRELHTATLLNDGTVLIAGGDDQRYSTPDTVLSSAELYSPPRRTIPKITLATVAGRNLIVVGENFDSGAVILINGDEQRTRNDDQNLQTTLIAKKAGRRIKTGDRIQVRNPDGPLSEEFTFTG